MREKWENYWYHYKLHTWIGIFIFLCGAYTLASIIITVKPDVTVTYIGYYINSDQLESRINEYLEDVIPDANGDGKKAVKVRGIITSPNNVSSDLLFLQTIELDFIGRNSYIYFADSFAYEALSVKGNLDSLEKYGISNDYLDVTEHELFSPINRPENRIYMCVRGIMEGEDAPESNSVVINGAPIINKIIGGH